MRETSPLSDAYQKYRAILFATFFFSFFVNALMFVGPLYMLQVYDRVLASRNETTLLMITLIAVGLIGAYGLLEYIRSRMLVRTGLQFDEVLAGPTFNRVVKMQLINPKLGGSNALADVDRIRDFITGQGILSFFDVPWVPLFLLLCFVFHPWIGITASVGALIILCLALLNEFMTRQHLASANSSSAGAISFANSTLVNAEVIRALGMEKQLSDKWRTHRDSMLLAQAIASDRAGSIIAVSKFVRTVLQVAILGVGAYLVLVQEITAGVMVASSIIMGRALAPVEQSVGQWRQFVAARQAHGRLKSLFQNVPADLLRTELPVPAGAVEVRELTSMIPGTRVTVLRNLSFSVAPGEVLAIVGPSGSGKSSLVRHLVGVWQPLSGSIRLDGAELQNWNNTELGSHLGYLPQEVRLFAGTVAQNISRFQEDASDAEIVAAARLAGAHDIIQLFAEGYDTQVGDGGGQLSGGQRQRVGLARAVYRLPSVIILDEPNSNLDSAGEEALAICIRELKRLKRTVIVVTHKANLLTLTDKTLVLANGMVQKFGYTQEVFRKAETPGIAIQNQVHEVKSNA